MFGKNWKKESARDTLALGGIAFYFICIGRALIGQHIDFVWRLIISAILIFIFSIVFRKLSLDYNLTRVFVLIVFAIIFYNDLKFSIFALILLIATIICSVYIWKDKKKTFYGIALGAIISIISYYVVKLYFLYP